MLNARIAVTATIAGLLCLGAVVISASNMFNHDHERSNAHTSKEEHQRQALIAPVPYPNRVDFPLIKAGWALFNDPNLSSNKAISCATCHNLSTNGAQDTPVSKGVAGVGKRNSPTVFNVSLNYRFFWDGRTNSLSKQMDGPIHTPAEMDSSWQAILAYVTSSSRYQSLFSAAQHPITIETIKHAIVTFQEQLLTPNSPFDRYLLGDERAISPLAQNGWKTFQNMGCINCHQGVNIGGSMMQRFGYYGNTAAHSGLNVDTGRHQFTKKDIDKHLFRVPSLRNVANTPPYFHNGSENRLEEAIKVMADVQLGMTLEPETIDELMAFLHALSAPRPSILEELEREQIY
ncbi:cytochrome-c peroxidase [Enterovibrio nigricans]|uniref:Cytochrome c peroxidase n=1 Tax=Enterovibrio nigricans DSM 22720 TaxID=1121868 RepID=A0A1T4VT37_9GAMM|nr:cytochrome c peroxidase [Enterovibrio nigricans]PKF48974.1 cytochrome B6 [Enterovibrio nigricans]SKA68005.1 cytochrome c peroxidase [Enterovibrio nigricans DSM 22720]